MDRWNSIRRHWDRIRTALYRWLRTQIQDALLVGCLWLIGLLLLGVPLAPLWAFLAALLQLIPNLGTVLSLIGPAFSAAFAAGWRGLIYVFILYAVIVIVDGAVLQPLLMKRNAKVPIWASILTPLLLGLIFNVWGFLLAPPLLAVICAYREGRKEKTADHRTN